MQFSSFYIFLFVLFIALIALDTVDARKFFAQIMGTDERIDRSLCESLQRSRYLLSWPVRLQRTISRIWLQYLFVVVQFSLLTILLSFFHRRHASAVQHSGHHNALHVWLGLFFVSGRWRIERTNLDQSNVWKRRCMVLILSLVVVECRM